MNQTENGNDNNRVRLRPCREEGTWNGEHPGDIRHIRFRNTWERHLMAFQCFQLKIHLFQIGDVMMLANP